ncbi:hypothetical protein OUZ56_028455 [Daphnia magna]|uniref:Uncharacterized protein n=1 Tax=Daphnia magna TaxID=35525 RepID=A0ABR0B402_9CRUS|nr:hypothetical protein OUZ56_028455 [Daphnia magna]
MSELQYSLQSVFLSTILCLDVNQVSCQKPFKAGQLARVILKLTRVDVRSIPPIRYLFPLFLQKKTINHGTVSGSKMASQRRMKAEKKGASVE